MIRYMEFPDGLVNILLWSGEIDERRPYKKSSNPKDLFAQHQPLQRFCVLLFNRKGAHTRNKNKGDLDLRIFSWNR